MSLAVINEPGDIVLSKNPVEFHLRSSAYVSQQPVAGVYELNFTTKLTTSLSTLTLQWGGNTVKFTVFPAGTAASGYNLVEDIAATTLADYVEQLADNYFKAQYLLDKDFVIEYVNPTTIRFTAKDAASVLTYSTTIPGGEAAMSTTTTPIQLSTQDDYAVIMDVEVEEIQGSGNYTRIGTLYASPVLYNDAGTLKGDFRIDVSELLHGFLQNRTDPPNFFPTATHANNTALNWRVVYAERYTILNESVVVRRVQSSTRLVLKGGLSYRDVPLVGDLQTNFYGAALAPWNTWQPDGKEVTAAEPHWLYFLTPYSVSGPDFYELNAVVYYTDGTTDTAVINTSVQPLSSTYFYRVGFNDEGLHLLQPSKIPYKYTVQLSETSGNMDSAIFTFWLVDETRQDRYFLYESSIQSWETLRCNGKHTAIADVAKTEAVNAVQAGYAATDAVVKQSSQGYADTFQVFTGYKRKAEAIHLREFINAENYFEIVDGKLVPIVVDAGSFELEYDETGSYAYGLKFQYRHAFVNKGHSNA